MADKEYLFAPARYQYTRGKLEDSDLSVDAPLETFSAWFNNAQDSKLVTSPEAVTLSTCELPSGRVSARMVLLKELDSRGFVVFSNWETSRKARDVASNARAALTFWWEPLQQQVRVEGSTERLTSAESQVYFDTRPRGSRIGAYASPQSQPIRDRAELDARVEEARARFSDGDTEDRQIPVPPFWGGLRIVPDAIEFWQGRENRLHDRFLYQRDLPDGPWSRTRLAP